MKRALPPYAIDMFHAILTLAFDASKELPTKAGEMRFDIAWRESKVRHIDPLGSVVGDLPRRIGERREQNDAKLLPKGPDGARQDLRPIVVVLKYMPQQNTVDITLICRQFSNLAGIWRLASIQPDILPWTEALESPRAATPILDCRTPREECCSHIIGGRISIHCAAMRHLQHLVPPVPFPQIHFGAVLLRHNHFPNPRRRFTHCILHTKSPHDPRAPNLGSIPNIPATMPLPPKTRPPCAAAKHGELRLQGNRGHA